LGPREGLPALYRQPVCTTKRPSLDSRWWAVRSRCAEHVIMQEQKPGRGRRSPLTGASLVLKRYTSEKVLFAVQAPVSGVGSRRGRRLSCRCAYAVLYGISIEVGRVKCPLISPRSLSRLLHPIHIHLVLYQTIHSLPRWFNLLSFLLLLGFRA
jgi:hypothetical protein